MLLDDAHPLTLRLTSLAKYPTELPVYDLQGHGWLSPEMAHLLCEVLSSRFTPGEVAVFDWVTWLKEHCLELFGLDLPTEEVVEVPDEAPVEVATPELPVAAASMEYDDAQIAHGETLVDRKSIFQAHLALVTTREQVKEVMSHLLSNTKIARATHNISAYRIELPNGQILQDCDDDGEAAAGGRLLNLLNIINVRNVVVVVSRWYGGVHLGPDRFKHINNVARDILESNGLISKREPPSRKSGKRNT
mmetsp:Transcript_22804/g.53902  ORF Transcript_22804/g.53902 Transcript_22804/m.53902 type:complete len:248 (+) Transcript_22804:152-895(+)